MVSFEYNLSEIPEQIVRTLNVGVCGLHYHCSNSSCISVIPISSFHIPIINQARAWFTEIAFVKVCKYLSTYLSTSTGRY